VSVTVTLHAWWLLAYLAVGAVLWLPLAWVYYRDIHMPDRPFWPWLGSTVMAEVWVVPLQVALWPAAIWDRVDSWRRRRRRQRLHPRRS
jgi:hypothetical protein